MVSYTYLFHPKIFPVIELSALSKFNRTFNFQMLFIYRKKIIKPKRKSLTS